MGRVFLFVVCASVPPMLEMSPKRSDLLTPWQKGSLLVAPVKREQFLPSFGFHSLAASLDSVDQSPELCVGGRVPFTEVPPTCP